MWYLPRWFERLELLYEERFNKPEVLFFGKYVVKYRHVKRDGTPLEPVNPNHEAQLFAELPQINPITDVAFNTNPYELNVSHFPCLPGPGPTRLSEDQTPNPLKSFSFSNYYDENPDQRPIPPKPFRFADYYERYPDQRPTPKK